MAAPQPVLSAERLRLRPLVSADAGRIQSLAGDRRIADTTLRIPHPYPDGAAAAWIAELGSRWRSQTEGVWAMTTATEGLVGAIGLEWEPAHGRAELGYWVGVPFAGRGYATEAARVVVRCAFDVLAVRRLAARHFSRNPASGRILEKLGMRREGVFRHQIIKWGVPEDVVVWAMLREDHPP